MTNKTLEVDHEPKSSLASQSSSKRPSSSGSGLEAGTGSLTRSDDKERQSKARATSGKSQSPITSRDTGAAGRKYKIGDLATEFGITPRAIRFYEIRGLLTPSRRGSSRVYSRRDRGRLMLIIRGKNLGFSLEDISEYLSLYDDDPTQDVQTRVLLKKVERHLDQLASKRDDIDRTIAELNDIKHKCLEHLDR